MSHWIFRLVGLLGWGWVICESKETVERFECGCVVGVYIWLSGCAR